MNKALFGLMIPAEQKKVKWTSSIETSSTKIKDKFSARKPKVKLKSE